MSFLNKKMSWTNAEFIPFKVCIAAAYLYLGSTFSEFFSNLQRSDSWIVRRITGLRDDALGEKNAFLKRGI